MFKIGKEIMLVLVLVLALVVPSIACVLPTGTTIWMFVGPGGQLEKFTVAKDQQVVFHATQPTQEMLKSFNDNPSVIEDWTDAKVVTATDGMNILVHEKDLNCPEVE